MKGIITISLLLLSTLATAAEVKILQVELREQGPQTWRAAVTLRHADTGWEHYADGWRVVTPDGEVLGHRTLHHPHVNEQPFTRSLSGIAISQDMTQVIVEAHDKVHGWSPDRVTVDLKQSQGERYRLERR
ncbi:MAG: hypothetical protein RI563_02345 [Thiohalophilus sp.]|uniref:hypothetical protein n=1 Tax=Thiohalophilus sp. TaxID=3028392 RepID=UPI0028705D6E|nr:hypothetical protein [Thiohalophilus sp.]MDR9435690.1 hypothetical protein [Thiohalophilus sp.]